MATSFHRLHLHALPRPKNTDPLREPSPKVPPPSPREPLWRERFDRTAILRCAAVTGGAIILGLLIYRLLTPYLSGAMQAEILAQHLPDEGHSIVAFLRLCLTRLPVLLLLAAAGLTRFSGGLTTAVLCWRGICDGAAIGLLLTLCQGAFPLTVDVHPAALLAIYLLWVLPDALIRCVLAGEARRMARACEQYGGLTPLTDSDKAALRYRLWHYTAISLGSLCASLFGCGLYTALLRLCM